MAAQTAPPAAAPADSVADPLTVYLVTVGPGEAVWEQFGHNALWVRDRVAGTDVAYNWGIFDFSQVGFIPRLLRGTMLYSMAPWDAADMVRAYASQDRTVWVQELALTPAQEAGLQRYVRWNALPENRDYRYDYYRDNCSTRVRDVLDDATDGALEASLVGAATGTTYRWHTRRLLQGMAPAYAGIELVLSERADRPIDRWEESFLPLRLMAHVRDVRVPDGAGGTRPLVASERVVYEATRAGPPAAVDFRTGRCLLAGLAIGLALALLSRGAAPGRTGPRVGVAVLGGLWAFASGLAGAVLLGAWLLTDHVFWYGNENLLQVSPLALAVAPLLVPLLVRRRPPRAAVALAAAVAGLSALGFALQALPGLDQVNGEVIALALPANLGLAVALATLARRAGGGKGAGAQ